MTRKEAPKGSSTEITGWKRDPEKQAMRERLQKASMSEQAWRRLLKTTMYLRMLRHPGMIRKIPEMREFFREQEVRTGLLAGAIFNQDLFSPTSDETQLEYKTIRPGTWLGYDFNRAAEFGERVKEEGKQHKEGRLFVFDLDEVADRAPDDYTPTGLFSFFKPDHVLQFDILPVSELIEKGYVVETTYNAAFERAGVAERYRKDLDQIGEHKVYMITPKGNGLVFLDKAEGGQKKPQREGKKQTSSSMLDIFVPQPAPTPAG